MQYAILKHFMDYDPRNEATASNVSISRDVFLLILESALRGSVIFNAEYYLKKYSDVKLALDRGAIESPDEHYFLTGYFEGRLPRQILVDERFYLKANPDVAAAIRNGAVRSAQAHFEIAGYGEGRLPYEGFSLLALKPRREGPG
jgi:hypothetical protein